MRTCRLLFPLLTLTIIAALVLPMGVVAAIDVTADDGPVPFSAQEGETDGSGVDVVAGSLWALAGVAIGGLIAGVFYLFKRRVGGFPKNPAWVAPITIMPSKEFPDEGYYGDAPADAHGHH